MNYLEKENRPWGCFYVIHDELNYKLKRIEVKPKQRLSYQFHKQRSESWIIIEGNGIVTINGKDLFVEKGNMVFIKKNDKHRIFNKGNKDLVFIEVQTGSYFGEDDIVRLKDDYKRK